MRFSSTLLLGVFATFASAQSTTTSSAVATTSAESAIVKCLDACDASDVNCRAKCIAVPNPDAAQVNATTSCVAACPQGNGTATDNLNYENCVASCIGDHYYTSTGTPSPTSAAGDADSGSATSGTTTGTATGKTTGTVTGTATGTAAGTATGSSTGTSTGSTASSTASTSAGNGLRVAASALGLVSFAAALMAL